MAKDLPNREVAAVELAGAVATELCGQESAQQGSQGCGGAGVASARLGGQGSAQQVGQWRHWGMGSCSTAQQGNGDGGAGENT